jgi:hypothetical protein
MKAFWYNVDSSFFKSWSPGVVRDHNAENHIHFCLYRKKTIFSRTSRPISIKLGTNHPLVKGILNCTTKGSGPLQRGDNHKNAKIWRVPWKKFFLQNHWAKIAHIYMKGFWDSAYLILYKLWSSRVKVGDTRGETIFTFVYWKESFKMKHLANFNQTWSKTFLHDGNSSLFKWRCKNRVGSFQYFLLMNHSTTKAQIIQVLPDIV